MVTLYTRTVNDEGKRTWTAVGYWIPNSTKGVEGSMWFHPRTGKVYHARVKPGDLISNKNTPERYRCPE